jgi:phosphohistidine phosphatase
MKRRLILYRHAKAETDSSDGDFSRSLRPRGQRDSKRMGKEIRALGMRFDLVLASPARRVVETLDCAGVGSRQLDDRLYNASMDDLIDCIRATDEQVATLMVAGHNPGLERLAGSLVGQAVEFPTCALAEIELPNDRWGEVGEGVGQLVRLIVPRDLD